MDHSNFVNVLMNPVRQRIVQYLIIHHKGTVGEIRQSLSDIPKASLYRHIKILLEANCLKVVSEKNVRGAVEKTYSLTKNPIGSDPTSEDVGNIIYLSLLELQGVFADYCSKNDVVQMQKDLLLLNTSTLMLSDEEFMNLLKKIGALLSEHINFEANEKRKPRRITLISSPQEGV